MGASRKIIAVAWPALALALLLGMRMSDRLYVDPSQAAPYRAKVKAAIESMSNRLTVPSADVPGLVETWQGHDVPLSDDALTMLDPNACVNRYYNLGADSPSSRGGFSLVLVNTKDARNVLGHYPPICYRSLGYELMGSQSWQPRLGDLSIDGREYRFARTDADGHAHSLIVRNFFILPDGRTCWDMQTVTRFAADYDKLSSGATEVQLVFPVNMHAGQRDAICQSFLNENHGMLETIRSGGLR